MWYREDPLLQQQVAEEHVRELQDDAERQRYYPDDPRDTRRRGRVVLSAPLVLGLVVVLLIVISVVGYLVVNR